MTIYAWHFSNGFLANGDGRKIVPGMALACNPEDIALCEKGFHASRNILDALQYANSNVLSYVACEGRVIEGDNKLVCSQRRHLVVADIANTLHEFACWCAEQALALIDNPDPRSIAAIEAKRKWLRGEIGDDQLAAAFDAAGAAAGAAARDAAWAATRAAAWAAAWAAAGAAAGAAAWAGARGAQNAQLTAMVFALPKFPIRQEKQ